MAKKLTSTSDKNQTEADLKPSKKKSVPKKNTKSARALKKQDEVKVVQAEVVESDAGSDAPLIAPN